MLSIQQIRRLVDAQAFGQLLDRVLANGRVLPAIVHEFLRRPGVIGPAAIGLSLQRCCELTYGPTALAADLSDWLLDHQCADLRSGSTANRTPGEGLVGAGSGDACAVVVAVATRGLLDFADQCRLRSGPGEAVERGDATRRVDEAIDRGLSAIARYVCEENKSDRDPMAGWIILWQLGDSSDFRERVDFDRFARRVQRETAELHEPTMQRLTRAIAA